MEIGLVGLLRMAWIAGILPLLVASLPFPRLSRLHEVVMGFAKRGKIMQSSLYKFTVPQRFFTHFYALAVIWTGLLLAATWIYAYTMAPMASEPFLYSSIASHLTGGSHPFTLHRSRSTPLKHRYMVWKSVFLLLLMEIQVLRRLYENIYVFHYSPSARMHIFGYLTGLFFYTAAPLSLCSNFAMEVYEFSSNQVSEFIVRGKDQMASSEFNLWKFVNPPMKLGWHHWIGAIIFFWSWIHQHQCHRILGSLRERREESHAYVVPHGDWFELVSCPHYLAEIVIYAGLVVASGGSDLTIWLLFGFVVVNLVFAAAETHRWYHSKFDNYPRDRYAVIPFIY
ncbi:polyprenol reductase 2-like isoform X1 [Syzygium oleosum]|uniref:polyprenol reductase 2-like isoform X1 n=1 Tax=Syzygium oleosum TaxID=219896 RepID=UPI0024B9AA59|nr:polyprenol reductase 2-like isoform X1 [Syzygium oleosum]XP_056158452.1 polyprenol reductase 2-like isoform X1 [Syzygium oleosum]